MNSQMRATGIGSTAIIMWATLAALTVYAGTIPPFQLTAMTFALAFGIGLIWWITKGTPILSQLKLPWR
ncbi:MAG: hypothetical protein QNJ45_19065, partial [Ardenticatenaceae bacterium]|nr:hypothetical protein [Ardenticatenaceae bacterium]